ncbi:hypothetical protein L6164_027970 [Bauhinia variegata]|uniref:Uncharacterized protein n=1 Tax=Bauhinia variegata TaxID=167791 RepID=A0ACB9LW91_BAUVA|nr:hypothetical protein L6164_027970 [Bauhinia variegata]
MTSDVCAHRKVRLLSAILANLVDSRGFPNQLEKPNEFEFLGDNISCINKSDSTNLAIGNQNNDTERNNISSSLASVPTFESDINDRLVCLSLDGSHFHKSNSSHFEIQNFPKEPPPAGRYSECSDEQFESSFVIAVINGLSGLIDDVYNYATFGETDHLLNSEDPTIETESHSFCERHLEKSIAVVENDIMQEPWQSQPVDPRGLSEDDEARVCDICGDVGREELLAICSKCTDGAEHIYCMRVKLEKVPESDWACEECLLMTDSKKPKQDTLEESVRISKGCLECPKSSNSVNHEPKSSERFNFRSSGSGRSGTNIPSSTSQLSAKRPAATLESQSLKKTRATGKIPVSPMSSKSCRRTLLSEGFSCKNLKKEKTKVATGITSVLQFSSKSRDKGGLRHACGDKRDAGSFEAKLENKRRNLDTGVVSPRVSKPIKHSLLRREPPFKNLENDKMEDAHNDTSQKKISNGMQGKAELPSILGDNSPKLATHIGMDSKSLDSVSSDKANATVSKVQPRKDSLSDALKKFSHVKELKTTKGNDTSELCDPATCLPVSDSGVTAVEDEKEIISCKKPVNSGPNCHKSGAAQSCGKQDYRLKPASCITHEDLNHTNKEEMKGSWQTECPAEATTGVRTEKLCSDFASNEVPKLRKSPKFDMAITSATNAIPEDRSTWLGKFLIHSSEGLTKEVPRLSTWPSLFVDRPVTEDNIALYFFAKDIHSHRTFYASLLSYMKENDLALKGNFDGVELLIFSSHVLPENLESWNTSSYLWGVFRGHRVGNSANTTGSNSQRNENRDRDSGRRWTPDLNVCPPDEEEIGRVHDGSRCSDLNRCFSENGEYDTTGTMHPGVGTSLGSDGFSDQRQAHPSKAEVVDLQLSLRPLNSVPVEMEVETELCPWSQNAVLQAAEALISLRQG